MDRATVTATVDELQRRGLFIADDDGRYSLHPRARACLERLMAAGLARDDAIVELMANW